jgi:hypothetical protein
MSENASNHGGASAWDLIVFRKAYETALDAHRVALTFPKYEQYDLASQLRRSSKSICANLMEGRGRQQGSNAEFRRFVIIAWGAPTNLRFGANSHTTLGIFRWKNSNASKRASARSHGCSTPSQQS